MLLAVEIKTPVLRYTKRIPEFFGIQFDKQSVKICIGSDLVIKKYKAGLTNSAMLVKTISISKIPQ